MTNKAISFLLVLVFGLLISCSDSTTGTEPEEPAVTSGTLEVTVTTEGETPDDNGYELSLDGTDAKAAGANATVTFAGLEEGIYELELGEVAANCAADGNNPQEVTVTAEETTSVNIQITCRLALKNQIVYASEGNSNLDLYVMDADGSNPQQLTNSPNFDAYPSVSPDGTQIVYSELSELSDPQPDLVGTLYITDVDGTNQRKLTTPTSGASDIYPKWSPGGTKIVFTRDYGADGNYDKDIFVIKPDGTELAAVMDDPNIGEAWASWSPDSKKIVFTSNETGPENLYVINSDGTGKEQLTDQPEGEGYATWSPDGSKIAFASVLDEGTHIFTIDVEGKEVIQVTKSSQDTNYFPVWSPDGSELVFVSDRNGNSEIYKKNADGTGLTVNLTISPGEDTTPAWSPLQ